MSINFDALYRFYVLARRLPYIFDKVSFVPLKFDHHVVWDVHEKFLQYHTAPPLPGKILHVINRRPLRLETLNQPYISELENIFSLLPREILRSSNYDTIRNALSDVLQSKALRGIIFQSPGAYLINERWLADTKHLQNELIVVVPDAIELRAPASSFYSKNKVKFLISASRFYEKGLHILFAAANDLLTLKSHYEFTLVTSDRLEHPLPKNITNVVLPRPTLAERRKLYTEHDYVLNLSLGDSLGVFLDAIRFGTPMIGYNGQHGSTYCRPDTSIMLDNPIFIYGPNFLEKYNMFEYELYLKNLEQDGFFEKDKQVLTEVLSSADNIENYLRLTDNLRQFAVQFSGEKWYAQVKNFYSTL